MSSLETARSDPRRPRARSIRPERYVPIGLLVLGLLAFFAFDLDRFIGLSVLQEHRETLLALVADHWLAMAAAYTLVYAVTVAFSIPGAVFVTLIGGFLFGTVAGSVLVILGATLGAVAVFLAARTAFGEVLKRRTGVWLNRLEGGFREDAVSYLLTLRLIPVVPFWLVNLVPAFLGVPLVTFAWTTLVGIIPGTVVYVAVGNGLGATLEAGGDPDLGLVFEPAILLPLLGLAVLSLLPVLYKRIKGRRPPGSAAVD